MKYSFIVTVYNEESTISKLLDSILQQTLLPHEVIIVDAKSSDKTASIIKSYQAVFTKNSIIFNLITKSGNRAEGRNEAIRQAKTDVLLISDAGCILDKNWAKEIVRPLIHKHIDVVAGFYKGLSHTIFEKCVVPYFLVMPDKVNEQEFLPATRSMAMKKSVWQQLHGFPEQYSRNEDYVFARMLKENNFTIAFAKEAIVFWVPPNNIFEAGTMFCRHAFGDGEAGILRKKVLALYLRYLFGIFLLISSVHYQSDILLFTCLFGLLLYISWSINKNYRYVQRIEAFLILPLLQLVSDVAVMISTTIGLGKKILFRKP